MAEWYEDSVQALTECILDALNAIVSGKEEYEGITVRQGYPQFKDTDLPLSKPVLTLTPVSIEHVPVAFGDNIDGVHEGMDVTGTYFVSVWTSRGLPGTPRSGSGGFATAHRILGQLMNDINLHLEYMPPCLSDWSLTDAPARTVDFFEEYDQERDLCESVATLEMRSEVWKRE